MTITTIIILSCLLILSYYGLFNLLRKNEKQEEIIIKQDDLISKLSEISNYSTIRLKEIDEKGTFESDDEIGWFFGEVKSINSMINQFFENEENEKEKGT